MLQSKVSQRLGVLKRIKHLLPLYARKLYVMTLIVPLFDYASIVWGDKNNKVLMNLLQVLHSKAAKLILNESFWSSSTEALEQLNWLTLSQRRELQRCVYMYNNLLGETLNFTKGTDLHEYNTRNKNMLRTFKSNTNWGLLRLITLVCIVGIPCLMIYDLYQLSRDLRKQLQHLLLNILNRTNLRKL